LPLRAGTQGELLLQQLRGAPNSRFREIELSFAQYAELDALQAVVGMAVSGDLEVDLPGGQTRKVTEQEVIESHHRRRRYQDHPLLGELVTRQSVGRAQPAEGSTGVESGPSPQGSPSDQDRGKVREFLASQEREARSFIMAQLALRSGLSSNELADSYVQHLGATRHIHLDPGLVKAGLLEVARKMCQEGLIKSSPFDGGLLLSLS
jgi:hypothetical protein